MRRQRKQRKRLSTLRYDNLEPRKLLAALIEGTDADDTVLVDYVAPDVVNITVNGEVMNDVDISDGLKINLKGDGHDHVILDHRIESSILVLFAEEISMNGGNNTWQIGSRASWASDHWFVGSVNGNVTFGGVTTIRGGSGIDTFSVDTRRVAYFAPLEIYGGEGDDVFWFSGSNSGTNSTDLIVSAGSIVAISTNHGSSVIGWGEGGNDRFVYRNGSLAQSRGGVGYDTVDYQRVNRDVHRSYRYASINGNDRIIGAEGHANSFVSGHTTVEGQLQWFINGSNSTVLDVASGERVSLANFNSFVGSVTTFDRFWVLATAYDVEITNPDWIQISSDLDASLGNLDPISHSINLIGYVPNAISYPIANVPPPHVFENYLNPVVVISDATGDGTIAVIDGLLEKQVQTITGMNQGGIRFTDENPATNYTDNPNYTGVQPRITLHGSFQADDFFTVNSTWLAISIYSHGGDDAFMIGSSNLLANGNLTQIKAPVTVFGGVGTDRLYLNDQSGATDVAATYDVSDRGIQNESGIDVFFPRVYSLRPEGFAGVFFNSTLEVARINGVVDQANVFTVTPSLHTRFIVDGSSDQVGNLLRIYDRFHGQQRTFGSPNEGAVDFEDGHQSVFFEQIETTDLAVEDYSYWPPIV